MFAYFRSTFRDDLFSVIAALCHPLQPAFIGEWRRKQYIAKGKARGATHVVTVWDSEDMEIGALEYVMHPDNLEPTLERIRKSPFSVGEVLVVN